MRKSLAILDTALEVASSYEALWQELKAAGAIEESKTEASQVQTYKLHIRNHRQSVGNLLDHSVGIANIVSFTEDPSNS